MIERLNVIEQEQDEYLEKEANEEEATTKSKENTEKELKEIKAWEGKESKGANIPEHEPDKMEADETISR